MELDETFMQEALRLAMKARAADERQNYLARIQSSRAPQRRDGSRRNARINRSRGSRRRLAPD